MPASAGNRPEFPAGPWGGLADSERGETPADPRRGGRRILPEPAGRDGSFIQRADVKQLRRHAPYGNRTHALTLPRRTTPPLILRCEAKPRVSKAGPGGAANSEDTGASFETRFQRSSGRGGWDEYAKLQNRHTRRAATRRRKSP